MSHGASSIPYARPAGGSPDFQYDILDSQREDFRLLQVLGHAGSPEMKCQVRTFSRKNGCPPYTAISYAWGDISDLHEIKLSGKTHYVHGSVWGLLHALRSMKPKRLVWIDAVCINQGDSTEKAWQVRTMRSIYARAEKVIIWLGPQTESSTLAMDYMTEIGTSGANSEPDKRTATSTLVHTVALLGLFSQPFWTRIWVVQEMLLARKLAILCGPRMLDWSHVLATMQELGKSSRMEGCSIIDGTSPETPGEILVAEKTFWDSQTSSTGAHLPLRFLLETYGHLKSSEKKDEVYALLGLSSSHCLPAPLESLTTNADVASPMSRVELGIVFKPDYKASILDLFEDTFRSVILYEKREGKEMSAREARNFGAYLATMLDLKPGRLCIDEMFGDPLNYVRPQGAPRAEYTKDSTKPTRRGGFETMVVHGGTEAGSGNVYPPVLYRASDVGPSYLGSHQSELESFSLPRPSIGPALPQQFQRNPSFTFGSPSRTPPVGQLDFLREPASVPRDELRWLIRANGIDFQLLKAEINRYLPTVRTVRQCVIVDNNDHDAASGLTIFEFEDKLNAQFRLHERKEFRISGIGAMKEDFLDLGYTTPTKYYSQNEVGETPIVELEQRRDLVGGRGPNYQIKNCKYYSLMSWSPITIKKNTMELLRRVSEWRSDVRT